MCLKVPTNSLRDFCFFPGRQGQGYPLRLIRNTSAAPRLLNRPPLGVQNARGRRAEVAAAVSPTRLRVGARNALSGWI